MSEMGGFEVIRKIRHSMHMPVILIVTAYNKYALEAFEAGAIDYLLKPVGQDRLAEAMEKARRITGQEAVEKLARLQEIAAQQLPGIRPSFAWEMPKPRGQQDACKIFHRSIPRLR